MVTVMPNQEYINKVLTTLMIGAVTWLFVQSLRVDPVVTAVDRLSLEVKGSNNINREDHKLIVIQLQEQHSEINSQNSRMDKNEVKLFRVVRDCDQNHADIKNCQAEFLRGRL